MDLLVHLDAVDDRYSRSFQRQGGTNLFLVCEKTRSFVNKWYETCCIHRLIDDSHSIIPNHPWFRDHRHDQSVYSILFKKYNFYNNNRSLYDCIICNRNKSGISEIEDDE